MISLVEYAGSNLVYQMKITLADFKPLIWCRVLVKASTPLNRLHQVIQIVMGWQDSHLHQFEINGNRYGQRELDDEDEELKEEQEYRLSDFQLKEGSLFTYRYDFGDDWEHEVVLEKQISSGDEFKHPICLEGMNACPPEDCGGVHGYQELLKVLSKPKHPEHLSMKEWLGGTW